MKLPAGERARLSSLTVGARVAATIAALLALVGAGCGPRSADTTASGGDTTTTTSSAATATTPAHPAPPSMIESGCKPSPQRPDPVILVPGTYGVTSWLLIAPALANLGYCVYAFTYGNNETADIRTSARELSSFVSSVLRDTGASRVAIVGHSEGGMMPRYYIKFLGGADKVAKLVGLAPSNHGTVNPAALGGALTGCIACAQQRTGSAFLTQLNAGAETTPPVDYTVIETAYDDVVIPYTSAFLTGPSVRVTNVVLQNQCSGDLANHLTITTDPIALQWIENALSSPGPADPSFQPTC